MPSKTHNNYVTSAARLRFGKFRKARFFASFLGLSLFFQMIYPNVALALTAGPASPEFSSFEPVTTTNMVNEFTGQFTYNLPVIEIPGANGGGYALSLSYHSGDGPESEASWVGSGWTLNPGSITRNKRGLPDDYKGEEVKYYNDVPKNWTIAGTGQLGVQIASYLGASVNATLRNNNYKGFSIAYGAGLSALGGFLSLGINVEDGNTTFSPTINPAGLLNVFSDKKKEQTVKDYSKGIAINSQNKAVQSTGTAAGVAKGQIVGTVMGVANSAASHYINHLLTSVTSPFNVTPYSGERYSGYIHLTPDPPPVPIGFDVGANVSYSTQKNVPERDVRAYGFMYSKNVGSNDEPALEGIMDYTMEKATNFTKRDKNLPIPFSTPDAYFVSGEGLGGSFRMYNDKIGIFSPNYVQSTSISRSFGVDIHVGLDFGVGAEGTVEGEGSMTVHSSFAGDNNNGNTDDYKFAGTDFYDNYHEIDESMFFRFNGDLGGKVVYDHNDDPIVPSLGGKAPYLFTATGLKLQGTSAMQGTNVRRNGRSSYIGYHTNGSINRKSGTGKRIFAYEKFENIHALAGRNLSVVSQFNDQVGEIATTNEEGNQYVYGLPVYCSGEESIQKGITNASSGSNNFMVYSDLNNSKTTLGEVYSKPYISSYLLTQITTPDFVDIDQNGPDDSDYGGYTRFTYKRHHGAEDKGASPSSTFYKWRIPYNGLYYNPMKLSSNKDNLGSYQSGYKEVYYVDSIVTKTHYAVFETSDRFDGKESRVSPDPANSSTAMGTKGVKKLDRIKLYAKSVNGGPDKLIKVVNFNYSYEQWPGTANSLLDNTYNPDRGKLTLKKVWFDFNGTSNAFYSPYEFSYQYPTTTTAPYPSEYQSIQSEMAALSLADQSPDYTPYIDCWGNYQYDGLTQRDKMRCWRRQDAPSNFDPAAWQLKRITLPSGGEIHVQYEGNTYSYVQDKHACTLLPLVGVVGNSINGDDEEFTINASSLGLNAAQLQDLADLINQTYKGDKIYFKFLYSLMGVNVTTLNKCNAEYIDGYVDFGDATVVGGNIKITVQSSKIPKDICIDYVKSEIGGNLLDEDCGVYNSISDPGMSVDGIKSTAKQLKTAADITFNANNTTCKKINAECSYFKIPVRKKEAGGIRVKRLMMYNKGIESGTETLYGTHYIYENEVDGTSFGVTTNEPTENNGENPLVNYYDKRYKQSWGNKLIAGKDKEQFEGPMGMNAIPSAAIGYSRVVKSSIHQSVKTGTGFTVVDYYTAKNYPFDHYYQALGKSGSNYSEIFTKKDDWDIDFGVLSYSLNTGIRSLQGYCFIQNQMHGQIKEISSYPGLYVANRFYEPTTAPVAIKKEIFDYFEPGEQIPMYNYSNNSIYYDQPGKEVDITIDRRSVEEETSEAKISGDITIGSIPPFIWIPYPIAFPLTSESRSIMSTLVTNKVIHYPAIVKRYTVTQEGGKKIVENVAFDPQTAKPVITNNYDGFHKLGLDDRGYYTTYNFPASSQYTGMAQKAWNEQYCFYGASAFSITPIVGGHKVGGVNVKNIFHKGDLLAITLTSGAIVMGHVTDIMGTDVAINAAATYGYTFPASTSYSGTKIEIVKSGHTNQLNESSGYFTIYSKTEPAGTNITFGKATSGSLITFSDDWQNNQTFGNVYEKGARGKWRPERFYENTNNYTALSYGGYFSYEGTTKMYWWDNHLYTKQVDPGPGYMQNDWEKVNHVLGYSLDGLPLHEVNLTGIHSAARYGYKGILPVITGYNTDQQALHFEGFECIYNTNYVEETNVITPANLSGIRHSGKLSYSLPSYGGMRFKSFAGHNVPHMIKFWAKTPGNQESKFRVNVEVGFNQYVQSPVRYVARSGEWALYEGDWYNPDPDDNVHVFLQNVDLSGPILIDDVCLFRPESKVSCYVYDPATYKPVAIFDENHFATFFTYNGEGKLVRKQKETSKGIRTVEETLYNTPKISH